MSPPTQLASRSFRGILLLTGSTAGQAVVSILFLAVLARLLDPTAFGMITAAQVITLLGDSFCRLGLGPALVQRQNVESRHIVTAWQTTMLLGVATATAMIVGRYQLEALFRIDGLADLLLPLALVFPLRASCVVAEALAQKHFRFGVIGGSQAASYFLGYGGCGIAAAYMGAGVWSLVVAQLAQPAIRTLILSMQVPHAKRGSLDIKSLRELLPLGLDVTAVELLSYIANQGDKFVGGRWLGAAALGAYGRAYQLTAAPALGFALIVDKILFPVLAAVQDQPERLRQAYGSVQTALGIITLPASVLLCLLAPEIIQIVLGKGWESAIVPLQWLAAGTFLRTGYKLSGTLARALGQTRAVVRYQAVYAIAVPSLSFALLPWGVNGLAFGVMLALVLEYLLLTRLSARLTQTTLLGALASALPGVGLAALIGLPAWITADALRALSLQALPIVLLSPLPGILLAGLVALLMRRRLQSSRFYQTMRSGLSRKRKKT
ncbi:lipopolysaccharide biosynthesis protein [Solimonas sp. SE-A11]|uniref:lipopolysaccharide biosynthesis protein n=1 Tax=Solimonas sp. SE-A11 TaxID=3054954 RepID=UPI00259CDCB8|nr:lipopolysaccharide biosynthesis protein [Solimonas sp. SE-A11]MDM4769740.1 lipopolysaccharide biosynthesis protein [Solimonas sp. SE-A11]